MNEAEVIKFIESAKWTKAKTYEKTSPHEYTVIHTDNPLRKQAIEFMKYIFDHGVVELYFGHPFTVCYIGDRKYWVMVKNKEEISDETDLINRTVPETTHVIYK